MGLKQTAAGRVQACGRTLGQITTGQTFYLHLFTNNHVPDGSESNTSPPYTDATFPGYAPVNIGWTVGPVDDGTHAQSQAGVVTFLCTSNPGSPEDVYGYYIVDTVPNEVIWSERFADAPRTISTTGDTIPVVPRYRHGDE